MKNGSAILKTFFALLAISKVCYATNNEPTSNVFIQDKKNNNYIANPEIRTVLLYPKGWPQADAVFELGGANPLLFSFDELSGTPDYYTYSVVHCDANWNESGLYYADYMDGFQQNPLNNYRFSFNTKETYAHFELELPNEQVSLRISGNYLIRVYGSASSTEAVLQWQFRVVEQLVGINLRARPAPDPAIIRTHQQLDCEIFYKNLPVTDPFSDLKLVVEQNTIPNDLNPLPQFSRASSADYSGIDKLVFKGLNEWRTFDTRSLMYNSINIERITLTANHYHVLLKPDESRAKVQYLSQPDFNGRVAIQGERNYDAGIELEYPIVYFTLNTEERPDQDVYLVGNFTGFAYTDNFKMVYNYERKAYELAIPLKQGFYNYMYAVKVPQSTTADLSALEGSHSETENSYSVYVYYRQPGSRYDRLVGYARIN